MTLNKVGLTLLAKLTLIVRQHEAEFSLVWEQPALLPKDHCEQIRCIHFTPHHLPKPALPRISTRTYWYL